MKTKPSHPSHHTTAERFHTGLIISGIVVAVIVSIFLAQDITDPFTASLFRHVTLAAKHSQYASVALNAITQTMP